MRRAIRFFTRHVMNILTSGVLMRHITHTCRISMMTLVAISMPRPQIC